jgi:hypothetical protein
MTVELQQNSRFNGISNYIQPAAWAYGDFFAVFYFFHTTD